MTDFEENDPDARLDRASELAETGDAAQALEALDALLPALEDTAERMPDSANARDDLGRLAWMRAIALARLGRFQEAVKAADAAVFALAQADIRSPDLERRGRMAAIRFSRASYLEQLGRRREALVAFREVGADAESISRADRLDLRPLRLAADARARAADLCTETGDAPSALVEQEHYVDLRRRALSVSGAELRDRLLFIAGLRVLGILFRDAGRTASGLTAADEALAIVERTAHDHPGDVAPQRESALTHATRGEILRSLGRFDEALAALERATFLTECLLSFEPDDPATRLQYVRRLEEEGDVHRARGDLAAARRAYERRLAAARALGEGIDLALLDLGDVIAETKDDAAALVAYEECRSVAEARLAARPGDTDPLDSLVVALERSGDALARLGRREEALAAYRSGAAHCRTLVAALPGAVRPAHALGIALLRAGELLLEGEQFADALPCLEEALELARSRAQLPAPTIARRNAVAVAHVFTAQALEGLGRYAQAAIHWESAGDIRAAISVEDREDPEWLEASYADRRRCARAQHLSGQNERALLELLPLLEYGKRFEAEDKTGQWSILISNTWDTIGDVRRSQGDLAAAATAGAEEAEAQERAAVLRPRNPETWVRACWKFRDAGNDAMDAARAVHGEAPPEADAAPRPEVEGAGDRWYERAVDAAERALALLDGPDPPEYDRARVLRALSGAIDDLGRSRSRLGNDAEASDLFERALVIDEGLYGGPDAKRDGLETLSYSLDQVLWAARKAGRKEVTRTVAERGLVVARRLVATEGAGEEDERRLRWALYAVAREYRDAERGPEARVLLLEAIRSAEARLAADPDDRDTLGLFSNVREIYADLLDRGVPEERELARAYYTANVDVHRRFKPSEIRHSDECTCLADNERKLRELDG